MLLFLYIYYYVSLFHFLIIFHSWHINLFMTFCLVWCWDNWIYNLSWKYMDIAREFNSIKWEFIIFIFEVTREYQRNHKGMRLLIIFLYMYKDTIYGSLCTYRLNFSICFWTLRIGWRFFLIHMPSFCFIATSIIAEYRILKDFSELLLLVLHFFCIS